MGGSSQTVVGGVEEVGRARNTFSKNAEHGRKLWKGAGEASCASEGSSGVYKGRKGFCLGMGKGMSRPGNTPVRKFLSDDRFVETVLEFSKIQG